MSGRRLDLEQCASPFTFIREIKMMILLQLDGDMSGCIRYFRGYMICQMCERHKGQTGGGIRRWK